METTKTNKESIFAMILRSMKENRRKYHHIPEYFEDELIDVESCMWPEVVVNLVQMLIVSGLIISASVYALTFFVNHPNGLAELIGNYLALVCTQTGSCDLSTTLPAFGVANIICFSLVLSFWLGYKPFFGYEDYAVQNTAVLGDRLNLIRHELQILKDRLVIDPVVEKLEENESVDPDTGEVLVIEEAEDTHRYEVTTTSKVTGTKRERITGEDVKRRYPEIAQLLPRVQRIQFEGKVDGEMITIRWINRASKYEIAGIACFQLMIPFMVLVFFGKPYSIISFGGIVVLGLTALFLTWLGRRK